MIFSDICTFCLVSFSKHYVCPDNLDTKENISHWRTFYCFQGFNGSDNVSAQGTVNNDLAREWQEQRGLQRRWGKIWVLSRTHTRNGLCATGVCFLPLLEQFFLPLVAAATWNTNFAARELRLFFDGARRKIAFLPLPHTHTHTHSPAARFLTLVRARATQKNFFKFHVYISTRTLCNTFIAFLELDAAVLKYTSTGIQLGNINGAEHEKKGQKRMKRTPRRGTFIYDRDPRIQFAERNNGISQHSRRRDRAFWESAQVHAWPRKFHCLFSFSTAKVKAKALQLLQHQAWLLELIYNPARHASRAGCITTTHTRNSWEKFSIINSKWVSEKFKII